MTREVIGRYGNRRSGGMALTPSPVGEGWEGGWFWKSGGMEVLRYCACRPRANLGDPACLFQKAGSPAFG